MTRTPSLLLLAALNAAVFAGCKGANRGAMGGDTVGTPSGAVSDTATMRPDTGMAAGAGAADTGMRPTTDTGTAGKKAGRTRVTGAPSDTALRAAPGTQTGPRAGQTRDTAK
jgi:hypothetical protein